MALRKTESMYVKKEDSSVYESGFRKCVITQVVDRVHCSVWASMSARRDGARPLCVREFNIPDEGFDLRKTIDVLKVMFGEDSVYEFLIQPYVE